MKSNKSMIVLTSFTVIYYSTFHCFQTNCWLFEEKKAFLIMIWTQNLAYKNRFTIVKEQITGQFHYLVLNPLHLNLTCIYFTFSNPLIAFSFLYFSYITYSSYTCHQLSLLNNCCVPMKYCYTSPSLKIQSTWK